MTFGPVVTSAGLAKNEIVRTEDLTERTRSDGIHCSGLQIHKDGSGDVFPTGGFVVVDGDTFKLQLGLAVISSGGVDSMFIADNLPELET